MGSGRTRVDSGPGSSAIPYTSRQRSKDRLASSTRAGGGRSKGRTGKKARGRACMPFPRLKPEDLNRSLPTIDDVSHPSTYQERDSGGENTRNLNDFWS